MPDISKWKAQNLKEMNCLFSDCNFLLYCPDVSNWNNYNENDLYEKLDYERIKKASNFSFDILIFPFSPDKEEYYNNIEFMKKQSEDRLSKFF